MYLKFCDIFRTCASSATQETEDMSFFLCSMLFSNVLPFFPSENVPVRNSDVDYRLLEAAKAGDLDTVKVVWLKLCDWPLTLTSSPPLRFGRTQSTGHFVPLQTINVFAWKMEVTVKSVLMALIVSNNLHSGRRNLFLIASLRFVNCGIPFWEMRVNLSNRKIEHRQDL